MSIRRSLVRTAVGAGALLLASAAPAVAHSDLESSNPGVGDLVSEPVDAIVLDFVSEVLADTAVTAVVVDTVEVSAQVSAGPAADQLVVSVDQPVTSGRVGVAVQVVAADGHAIEVTVEFDVAAPDPTTTTTTPTTITSPDSVPTSEAIPAPTTAAPTLAPPSSAAPQNDGASSVEGAAADAALAAIDTSDLDRWDNLQAGLRAISYALTIGALGAGAFGWIIRRDGPSHREATWLVWLTVGLVATTLVWLGFQSAIVRGGDSAAISDPDAWSDALAGSLATGFWLRLLGASAMALSTRLGPSVAKLLALAGAGMVALSFGLLGHSATASPRAVAVGASAIHVAAVGIWIGGLAILLLALRLDSDSNELLVSRFSRVAAWTLVPVVVAGISLAVIRIDRLGDLFDTAYGKILVAKLLVVVVILAFGARNNTLVRQGSVGAISRLRRLGLAEVGFTAIVVVLTTVLVANA